LTEDEKGQINILKKGDSNRKIAKTIHTTSHSMSWFAVKNIPLMNRSARCPDLNPIVTLWIMLVRDVYKNERQYSTCIDHFPVINKKGGATKYSNIVQ
jgi:hypothetical protein